jgi:hypothetical protein
MQAKGHHDVMSRYITRNNRKSWQKIEDGKSYCLNMDEVAKTCRVVVFILSGERYFRTIYSQAPDIETVWTRPFLPKNCLNII